MLSENIKRLRNEKGITQKDLADQLHVTAQAVSRWETGEVEPSIGTLSEMATIFDVTTDELIREKKTDEIVPIEETSVAEETKEEPVQEYKPVLAVCEKCNKPIYSGFEIVRQQGINGNGRVICKSCYDRERKIAHNQAVEHGIKQRKRSIGWGITITAVVMLIVYLSLSNSIYKDKAVLYTCCCLLLFPFISCLFLENNFILAMFAGIASLGYIKLPGIIFSFDLDGIVWLITVKIGLWLLSVVIATAFMLLAVALCSVISVFVYPFALSKNIKYPEESEPL